VELKLTDGGIPFTIRIWTKGNIPEMEQLGMGAEIASCVSTA
jgi:hypothetical protein